MPHVVLEDGRDLGEVTDPHALAYYRGEGATITDMPAPDPEPAVPPSRAAVKAEWVAYAAAVDPDRDVSGMTKDELVAAYGQPEGQPDTGEPEGGPEAP